MAGRLTRTGKKSFVAWRRKPRGITNIGRWISSWNRGWNPPWTATRLKLKMKCCRELKYKCPGFKLNMRNWSNHSRKLCRKSWANWRKRKSSTNCCMISTRQCTREPPQINSILDEVSWSHYFLKFNNMCCHSELNIELYTIINKIII